MNALDIKNIKLRFIALCCFAISALGLSAQDISSAGADSNQVQKIELADISIRSSETILSARHIDGKLISKKRLNKLSRNSDSIITIIDSVLYLDNQKNIQEFTSRTIDNNVNYWKQKLKLIEDAKSKLTTGLHNLDDYKYTLAKESSIWENTKEALSSEDFNDAVVERIDEVLITIDSVQKKISVKGVEMLRIFDNVNRLEIRVESRIEKLENETLLKQQQLFVTSQPSLFTLDYGNKNNWQLSAAASSFYREDLKNLKTYLQDNVWSILLHLILISLLIVLFVKLHKANIAVGTDHIGAFYIKRFKTVLSSPVSIALVLGLFASVIIYPDSPLVFKDIIRIFVVFPLVIILVGILRKRYHLYVYILALLILLQLIYVNLSTDKIISRFILLFMSTMEAFAIFHFIRFYKHRNYNKAGFAKVVLILSYIFLAMSVGGLLGDVIGKVMLAEYFIFSVVSNALVGTLIGLSLVALNGLVVVFLNSVYANKMRGIRLNKRLLIHNLTRLLNISAFISLIYYILKIAGWEVVIFNAISDWLSKDRIIGSMEFTWGSFFLFFIVIWLSIIVSKIVRSVLEEDVLSKMKLKSGVGHTIALMVRYALVTAGVFIAVTVAGIPFSEFAIIFGAFGVGIGFGLQNIFNNLVSGFILLFERPIKINDTIEVGTLMGNVKSIGIRASNVRTFDGAEIIVPNGNLISNEVINWTLSDQTRRIEVIVGVSYNSDPHAVHDVLMNVLEKHKDIVNEPAPSVFFRELGDSSLNFRMLGWTSQFDQWIRIKSEILFAVFDDLKAAGIEIPFPQRDLHLRSVDKNAGILIKNSIDPEEKPSK